MMGGEAVPSSVVKTWYPFATSQPLRQNWQMRGRSPQNLSCEERRLGWGGGYCVLERRGEAGGQCTFREHEVYNNINNKCI